MSVDTHSYDLAEFFLQDFRDVTEAEKMALAQAIQDEIEGWLATEMEGRGK